MEAQPPVPAEHVENAIVRFLKSRLPGPKTERGMRQMGRIVQHLPEGAQNLATALRPVIKAGMYAGNCVGTVYEGMLAASVGLGAIAIAKEGFRMVPIAPGSTEIKRKGLGGVWKDLNLGSVPKNLWVATRPNRRESTVIDTRDKTISISHMISILYPCF